MQLLQQRAIPIVFTTNEHYAKIASISILSIIAHSQPNVLYRIYILHNELSIESIRKLNSMSRQNVTIECIDISNLVEKEADFLYPKSYFPITMYYRWFIPEALPQYDRVIYIDCDTVACVDISPLMSLKLGDAIIGGVINFSSASFAKRLNELGLSAKGYINAGLFVMDTGRFMKNMIKNKCIDFLRNNPTLACPDQDALNYACQNQIAFFDTRWNLQWHHLSSKEKELLTGDMLRYFEHARSHPYIIHFTAQIKPWHDRSKQFSGFFWQYVERSPFQDALIGETRTNTDNKELSVDGKLKL